MNYYNLDEQRLVHADEALSLDGVTDAAFGDLPTRVETEYLTGYIAPIEGTATQQRWNYPVLLVKTRQLCRRRVGQWVYL